MVVPRPQKISRILQFLCKIPELARLHSMKRNLRSQTLKSLCLVVCSLQVLSFTAFAEPGGDSDASSQYLLARKYELGDSVRENPFKAVALYRKAADQGHPAAQYSLGRMFAAGSGVRQDYTEALRWFQKAAAQNYALAQNRIGVMYEKGQGIAQDSVEAYKWYFLASRQNENIFAVANCEVLSRRMTSDQIAEGQKRATATEELTIANSD